MKTFLLQLPGMAVAVGLGDNYLSGPFSDLLGPLLTDRAAGPLQEATIGRHSGRYRVEIPGERPRRGECAGHALVLFEHGLFLHWAGLQRQGLVLHAAAVARRSRALVLLGDKGAGKSTLAAALVQRGWLFAGDETVLLEYRPARVRALYRPLRLKRGWRALAPLRGERLLLGTYGGDARRYPLTFARPRPRALGRGRYRPAALVLLERRARAGCRLERLRPAAAARALFESAYNAAVAPAVALDCLARLLNGCPAWRLEHGRLERALELLEGLAT